MSNELENSLNYIKKKATSNSGFSIPKNYIDGIEDDFLLKLKEKELPNGNPFDLPKNYFKELETEILNKVSIPSKKGKVISLKSKFFKLIPTTIAASLLVFIGLQFFKNKDTSINFNNISHTDAEDWLEDTTIYTDTELAFIFEEDIDETDFTLTTVDLSDAAIEDYFNSIDHADLLNEI